MNIKDERENLKGVPIGSLEYGDTFQYKDKFFILTCSDCTRDRSMTDGYMIATNLYNGQIHQFVEKDLVVKVSSELVIK